MKLSLIREYEKTHPRRVHQAAPREEEAPAHRGPCFGGFGPSYPDHTQLSQFCQVSSTPRHGQCFAQWCKCLCHEHEHDQEYYGYGI